MKGLVNAGAEPVFVFYLEDRVDEKLTINGVNRARTAGFREDQRSVIDTMLFICKQERQLLSAITRLISSGSGSSVGIMPCSQSSREHWVQRFCFRGRSDHNIGASR